MLTLIKPNEESDADLAWRKSLKPGDEVVVAYPSRKGTGTAYLLLEVLDNDGRIIEPDGADPFLVETGMHCQHIAGKRSAYLVKPTAEIRAIVELAQALTNYFPG